MALHITDEERIAAIRRLGDLGPETDSLRIKETEARLNLAATLLAMDEAAAKGPAHAEQMRVVEATGEYGQALLDLLRGEES